MANPNAASSSSLSGFFDGVPGAVATSSSTVRGKTEVPPNNVVTVTVTTIVTSWGAGYPPAVPATTVTVQGGTVTVQGPAIEPSSCSIASPPAYNNTTASSIGQRPSHSQQPCIGVNGGELAGAIIGSVLGAAVIAVLATALICARKQNRSSTGRTSRSGSGLVLASGKGQSDASEKRRMTLAGPLMWMAHLPQSADDGTVRNAFKAFLSQVDLHVENFYTKSGHPVDDNMKLRLAGLDSGRLPRPIDILLADTSAVMPTIKHCIALMLISHITPGHDYQTTLLPARLNIQPTTLENSSVKIQELKASRQAYSQWKLFSAFLFTSPEEDESYLQHRDQQIQRQIDFLDSALAPWRLSSDNTAAGQNFRGLAKTAASLGLLLMSQPCEYEFWWGSRRSHEEQMIVYPGLRKMSDERGRALERPQVLVGCEAI